MKTINQFGKLVSQSQNKQKSRRIITFCWFVPSTKSFIPKSPTQLRQGKIKSFSNLFHHL